MESGGDQTVKETVERLGRLERLSFNVCDEQEIFPPLIQNVERSERKGEIAVI